MKKFLFVVALMLSTLVASPVYAQQGFTQSFFMAPALAPPAVVAGQSNSSSTATGVSTSATGGTIVAGLYRVCVTFFSISNTETPCSTDTAATSVITTTGTTSIVTIYPPVSANGTGSIIGWRPYVGASAGASGAEALVTPTAAICTLSASATASCSLQSPAVFTSTTFASGSGGPATPGTLYTYPTSNAANLAVFENGLYPTSILSWTVTGTAPGTCTVQLQTGTTIAGLANVGQSLTCTATGSYALPSTAKPVYMAPNITAWTAGDTTTVETFSITTLPYISPIYWGPAAPTSACAAPMGAFFLTGAASNLYTCVTTTWTAITLP